MMRRSPLLSRKDITWLTRRGGVIAVGTKPAKKKSDADRLVDIYNDLSRELAGLAFASPVTHVYNTLEYAADPVRQYLELAGNGSKEVVFLGMNPGPWGWARDRLGTPEAFFDRLFVANYCPLVFMEESGKNRTPDELQVSERRQLSQLCDTALQKLVEVLQPEWVIGIGKFAEDHARATPGDKDLKIKIPQQ